MLLPIIWYTVATVLQGACLFVLALHVKGRVIKCNAA